MAKLTLSDITSGYNVVVAYNANNALIEAALENTLSRDGSTPNTMSADIDMNSNSINNVIDINMSGDLALGTGDITTTGTINTTSFIINGTVIIPTSEAAVVAAAPDATQVSFTPTGGSVTTLQDALDDDYNRVDANTINFGDSTSSVAFHLNAGAASDAIIYFNESGGTTGYIQHDESANRFTINKDIFTSGDITGVNATFTGTSAFTGAMTIGGDDVVPVPAQVSGHIRAGNLQLVDGEASHSDLQIATGGVVTTETWESIGATGSGADNIWAEMDAIPAEATMLVIEVELHGVSTGGADSIGINFCSGDIASPTPSQSRQHQASLMATFGTSEQHLGVYHMTIPLGPTNQDFKVWWSSTMTVSSFITLRYKGFVTD